MKRHRNRNSRCPNCGRHGIADAAFCPDCGQQNQELEVPFRHLVAEVLEHTLHLDSKLFRTAKALALRPGFLTREFIEGRRQLYVPPVRLYIFVSVLFFFLLAVLPATTERDHATGVRAPNSLNLSLYTVDSDLLVGLSDAQLDSVMTANNIDLTPVNRYLARKLAMIAEGGKSEFSHLLVKNISYMMFALMPLFALFVYLLFRRSARYYLWSLIYAVHLHSFFFLLLTVELLLGRILPVLPMLGVVAIVSVIYSYVSLLRLFAEPAGRTFLKASILGVFYVVSMVVFLMLVVLASIVLF